MGDDGSERTPEPRFAQRERLMLLAGIVLLVFLATLVMDPDFVREALTGVRDTLFRN